MKRSVYQEAIVNAFINERSNLLINAVAGSGKTTTLMELVPYAKGSVLLTAFNVSIAKTLNAKLTAKGYNHAIATNIHKLGYKLLADNLHIKLKVESYKYKNIIKEYLKEHNVELERLPFADEPNPDKPTKASYLDAVEEFVRLAQLTLLSTDEDSLEAFISLVDHYGLDIPKGDYLIFALNLYAYCEKVGLEQCVSDGVIDFNDMITIPAKGGYYASDRYDYIFIDECQDLNTAQLQVILAYGKKFTRYIAVGDRNQAIYGFAGSDTDNFTRLGEILSTKELPLSVCYRCAKRIVSEAKSIVPHIESFSENPLGSSREEPIEKITRLPLDPKECAILARKNSQLVKLFFTLLKAKIPSYVLGKEVGKSILKLLEKFKEVPFKDLPTAIENYRKELATQEKLTTAIEDRIECLLFIQEECTSFQEVKQYLEDLFSEDKRANSVMLSSIHKSKGSEWRTVYLVKDCLPLRFPNMKDWQWQQELNLKYVAITRAIETLVWLTEEECL